MFTNRRTTRRGSTNQSLAFAGRWIMVLLLAMIPSIAFAAPADIVTVAGTPTVEGYSGDSGAATSAKLNYPTSIAIANTGDIYIADQVNNRIRKVAKLSGVITTIAGTGVAGYSGDAGAATSAMINGPSGIAFDRQGNLYIADSMNNVVRKVTTGGTISTVAGDGTWDFYGDGDIATAAALNYPIAVAVDASDNLYISDYYNHRIRKVDAATGFISTIAGTGEGAYYVADENGPAIYASIYAPSGMAFDATGKLYFADSYNHMIRVIGLDGKINKVAGTGVGGFGGDGGDANSAQLYYPNGVTIEAGTGYIFIADSANNRVRVILGTTIITIAGNGTAGYAGDGAIGTSANLDFPTSVALDAAGNVFFVDEYNQIIRRINETTPPVTTPQGYGYEFGTVTTATNVIVILSANDPGTDGSAGIATNYPKYCVAGSGLCAISNTATYLTYNAPFVVSCANNSCSQNVWFFAQDTTGNVEEAHYVTVKQRNAGPTGTITINGGSTVTNNNSVILNLTAQDDNKVAGYYLSSISNVPDPADPAGWVAVSPTAMSVSRSTTFATTAGEGLKTIYVWYKDTLDNISDGLINGTITVDQTVPVGFVTINNDAKITNSTTVNLSLNASDTTPGQVVAYFTSNNNSTPASFDPSWHAITPSSSVTDLAVSHSMTSANGVKNVYVWYKDTADNVSAAYTNTITLDTAPFTGWLKINNSVAMTNSVNATIKISGTNANKITGYFIGNNISQAPLTNTGSGWVNVAVANTVVTATISNYKLIAGSGTKTIYVWYRDKVGLVSDAISNTIILDDQKPTGSLRINGDAGFTNSVNVTLTLSASDDRQVAAYYKSNIGNTPAASATGWTATSLANSVIVNTTIAVPTGAGTKSVYVWYKDTAGNVSLPITNSIYLDNAAPTNGLVKINNGDAFTNSSSVTLSLYARDMSNIVSFCNSNSATKPTLASSCWQAAPDSPAVLNTTASHTLLPGAGAKIVYVWYADRFGYISAMSNATITMDTVKPVGTVSLVNTPSITNSTSVLLSLTASDVKKVAGYYKSNDSTTPTLSTPGWVATALANTITNSIVGHTLSSGDGSKTVYVWYRDIAGNISNVASTNPITLDTTPPNSGTVMVNFGAATTNTTAVSLLLTASDINNVVAFYNSNTNTAPLPSDSAWKNLNPAATSITATSSHVLTHGDGVKTVYVWYKDALGNVSSVASNHIDLDTTAPTGSLSINNGIAITNDPNVTLTLNGFDADPGQITAYVIGNTVDEAPASVDDARWIGLSQVTNSIVDTAVSHTLSAGDGVKSVYVWYKDKADNISLSNITATTKLDTVGPDGSVTINGGSRFTNSTTVTLTLSATDVGNIIAFYNSTDSTAPLAGDGVWNSIVDNSPSFSNTIANFELPAGEGVKTVYVWYKDQFDQISAYTATISIDNTAPSTGSVAINEGALFTNSVNLSLTVMADDPGGEVVAYFPSTSNASAPLAATSGWVNVTTPSATMTDTGVFPVSSGDGTKTVYVWYKDAVGNVSNVTSSSIVLDTVKPTGHFSINKDTGYTNSTTVTLNIHAADNNRVAAYYAANTANTPAEDAVWVSMSPAAAVNVTASSYVLDETGTTKHVYVWYKDSAGNVSATAFHNSVTMDTSKPLNGIVNTTAGNGTMGLTWRGFADTKNSSGVINYRIARDNAAVPAAYCGASAIANTTGASFMDSGLTMDQTYYYRVCAMDKADNISSGSVAKAKVKKDLVGSWVLTLVAEEDPALMNGVFGSIDVSVGASGAVTCGADVPNGICAGSFVDGGILNMTPDGVMINGVGSFMDAESAALLKSNGSEISFVRTDALGVKQLGQAVKTGSGFAISNIAGDWVGFGIVNDTAYDSFKVTQTLNTSGGVTACAFTNSAGVTGGCIGQPVEAGYTINANGTLSSVLGSMNATKDSLVFAKPYGAGYAMTVMSKVGGTFVNNDSNGTWVGYGILADGAQGSAPYWSYAKLAISGAFSGTVTCLDYVDSDGAVDDGTCNNLTALGGTGYSLDGGGNLNATTAKGVMNLAKDRITLVRMNAGTEEIFVLERVK